MCKLEPWHPRVVNPPLQFHLIHPLYCGGDATAVGLYFEVQLSVARGHAGRQRRPIAQGDRLPEHSRGLDLQIASDVRQDKVGQRDLCPVDAFTHHLVIIDHGCDECVVPGATQRLVSNHLEVKGKGLQLDSPLQDGLDLYNIGPPCIESRLRGRYHNGEPLKVWLQPHDTWKGLKYT
jgi:hypothetical protein